VQGSPASIHVFDRPPVVEVALSVQFARLPLLRPFAIRDLWATWAATYPNVQEQPTLPPLEVELPRGQPSRLRIALEPITTPSDVRYWFSDEASRFLIQVQQDRFVFNWRRAPGDDSPYPRYATVRENFLRHLAELIAFLQHEEVGDLRFNATEVTYINHIPAGQGWAGPPHLEEVIQYWRGVPQTSERSAPRDVAMRWRYEVEPVDGISAGHLLVALDPARHLETQQDILSLQLIARGLPSADGVEGAVASMDAGREWIVRRFVEMTTPKMHAHWGRQS